MSYDNLGDPAVLVRRSQEDVAQFDSHRIVEALVREARIDPDLARQIGLEVREFILRLGFRNLSSSLIRGLVDAKLLELGLEDAHRSHTRLGVPSYDVDRILRSSFREASSQPFGPDGTSLILAEAIKREYAIQHVFSEQVANAHLLGDIHISATGAVDRPHSLIAMVDYVKRFGIALPHGLANSRPARHADVLLAHIVKLSAVLGGYLSGPVVWDSINYGIAPFIEGLDQRAVKQLAQMLAFEFSAPAVARGGQLIVADVHLDWAAPPHLSSRPAIGPGGRVEQRTYGEYEAEARRFLDALLDVYLEGDGSGRGFLTPRLILHVSRRFLEVPEYNDAVRKACHLAVERGGVVLALDRDDDDVVLDRYGITGESMPVGADDSLRSAWFQIVSLNLPRVGYLASGNLLRVFEELTRLMETAAQAHLEKRVFIEKLLALGDQGPLAALTTRAGGAPLVKLNLGCHAIGIVGLNELCRAVFQSDLNDSDETWSFALRVLTHLKNQVRRLSNKHKVRFVLTGESSEVAAYRLARLDMRFYADLASSAVRGDPDSDAAYYSDGVRLAASSNVPFKERVRTEGHLHEFGFLNPVTELWISEPPPSIDLLMNVVSKALDTSCSGLAFCPEFTVCSACGVQSRGLASSCPGCGSQRVDGLAQIGDRYGYTSGGDIARQAELRDRRRFTDSEV
jgi:ribonucleoside-triphosphate reductase